ncbi:MAG: tetratricopeptide repeat protein [Alphaproteobacteria bacterium]|nr:tetratricopeptide repeat protein [Alphaproteobacteria bacterium]
MNDLQQRLGGVHERLRRAAWGEAEELLRDLFRDHPNNVTVLYLLGVVARAENRPEEALHPLERALAIEPRNTNAWLMYAGCLSAAGRSEQAVAACEAAVGVDPEDAGVCRQAADIFLQNSAKTAALRCYQGALDGEPDAPFLEARTGRLLAETGAVADGLARAEKAAARAPAAPDVQADYARALIVSGRFDDAERVLDRARAAAPDDRDLLHIHAKTLRQLQRLDEAERTLRKLVAIDPRDAAAYRGLGMVELNRGNIALAIDAFGRAATLQPRDSVAESNANMALLYDDRATPRDVADAHRAWARRHADRYAAAAPPFANPPDPDRRLKVGLVSADLRTHSVTYFLEPLLEAHDGAAIEITCFDSGTGGDETTRRLQALADGWHNIAGAADAEIVELIRGLGIDVLVDLSGRTVGNRALVFAARAAPVQIAYLGYPATTGLTTMDYRLTDAVADPPGATEAWHSETLLRLEPCFLCYRPRADAPPIAPPAMAAAGSPTFGSFNNTMKLSETTIALWSAVLGAVPAARLVVKFGFLKAPEVRRSLIARFADHGIDAERLDLRAGGDEPRTHLAAYGDIDIALDPTPYNGTTTTCEALWMGVPVLTVAGAAHVSRVGASILTAAGLPELVCRDGPDLARRAAELAAAPERLAELRRTMRERLDRSPLTAGPGFARRFEGAVRTAWRAWCTRAED